MKTVFILMMMVAMSVACQSATNENHKTAIMNEQDLLTAVRNNDIQSVANALANGAAVNTADGNKRSLLLLATSNNNIEMAKLLVKNGGDVNQQSDNQDSPFLYAGASGQTELVELFLQNGARFDVFNRYNGSALIPACERGHVETVRLLANTKNFPVDHINRLGWTGLMEAIVLGDGSKKYQEIIQILKDAGAKMEIPDQNGITPLQHAQERGFKEIVDILKS
jgi:ankyrin repeat protein